jgi:hypothetical protein
LACDGAGIDQIGQWFLHFYTKQRLHFFMCHARQGIGNHLYQRIFECAVLRKSNILKKPKSAFIKRSTALECVILAGVCEAGDLIKFS